MLLPDFFRGMGKSKLRIGETRQYFVMYYSNLPRGNSVIGRQRTNVIVVSVRVPTQDIVVSFSLEKTCSIQTLYESVVEKLMLTPQHHYLTLEDDATLCTNITLGELAPEVGAPS